RGCGAHHRGAAWGPPRGQSHQARESPHIPSTAAARLGWRFPSESAEFAQRPSPTPPP
ncbi:hypothetical protein P7K49_015388, partial [Saguinus oedipus]